MSEKEVRRLVRKYGEWHNAQVVGKKCLCAACENASYALSEPPDVVVLLRKMDDMLCGPSWDEEGSTAIAELISYVVKKFHVRLTADGREWVEEGDADREGD